MRTRQAPLLILFVLCGNVFAQYGKVEVRVVNTFNEPVVGASIELIGKQEGAQAGMTGVCEFDRLKPGIDTLKVSCIAYNRMLVPFAVKPDTITRIDVRLLEALFKHSDGGWCGTPTHAEPAPSDYSASHSTISYAPIPR